MRKLLDRVRICLIPVLNPDGYEIAACGYNVIRNPIYRQMLKMQNRPVEEFNCNARGVELGRNFPTNYYQRRLSIRNLPVEKMKNESADQYFSGI